ncbi:MAG: MFS transporter [Planctomycetota bacterium]
MADNLSVGKKSLTTTEWLICIMAAIGFAFDIYELLMMPLIAGPALAELLRVPIDSPLIRDWVGYIFWSSALAGGFFGMIGGYLTDRFGRRRVLVWSILLYAVSAAAAGFSTSAEMLLILRCTTFIGVCVEFVAAIAWLAELFPEPKQRESVLGYTQAFSSIGGISVTGVNFLIVKYATYLPPIMGEHSAWRYTLISGLLPAIPLILIRPFLPESPAWQEKKAAGTLRRPSLATLFAPQFRRTTIVTTLMFACSYGAAFGAIQLAPTQIVPGIPQLRESLEARTKIEREQRAAEAQLAKLPKDSTEAITLATKIDALRKQKAPYAAEIQKAGATVQFFQEIGGLLGRFALAFLAIRIVSRQSLLRIFQIPGLILVPLIFYFPARDNLTLFQWGLGLAGFLTVAQFSFWGNYLPRVYPTYLRGTGEGVAANIGGRMIGTSAAFVTTQIASFMPGNSTFEKVAFAAAGTAFFVYLLGTILCFFLPEPPKEEWEE